MKAFEAHPAATEDVIQKHILQYLRMALPNAVIHHSPNQVQRSGKAAKIEVTKKLGMGMVAGYPDLVVHWRGVTAFIEVKRPKEYPTPHQREVHENLRRNGCMVMVCRSVSDAEGFVRELKVLTKGAGF